MQKFFIRLDNLAGIETENSPAKWLERTAFFFLILMILAAPHSIAATQTAWLAGMTAWFVRLFVKPRPPLVRTKLDAPLWIFFGWTVLTSLLSYAPDISIDKLRNATLFLIFYFIINVVKTKRAVVFLAFALIFSCMFNAVWMPVARIGGRGVEIHGVKPESPLKKASLVEGDTLLEADKEKILAPENLIGELERNETVTVKFYRADYYAEVAVKRADLLGGQSALERLGIESWKPSRNWRSAGFYAHYTTYAEVLQLVASLVFGLLIASLGGNKFLMRKREDETERIKDAETDDAKTNIIASPHPVVSASLILLFCLGALLVALLLSVTRASQAAFLVSALAIVLINGNRKLVLASAAIVLPLALIGVFLLQQSRQVGVIDTTDGSTQYRLMMYRDGFRLWTSSARNFALGVGMDSIKRYWREWDLFDKGWQPMGHFHSTPLQLAVERGLPALLLWLWVLWSYARLLWRDLKLRGQSSKLENQKSESEIPDSEPADWQTRGIVLGAFGGLIGFFTGGLVHYNYGDAVVAMMFFILMGLSVKLTQNVFNRKWKMENSQL